MGIQRRMLLALGLTVSLDGAAAAQNYDPTSYFPVFGAQHGGDTTTVYVNREHTQRFPLVRGAPFYGEEADQHIREEAGEEQAKDTGRRAKMWRDFEGRLRAERPPFPTLDASYQGYPDIVTICDLPAGLMYVLDLQHKIAHRFPCEQTRPLTTDPAPARPPSDSAQSRPVPPPDPSRPAQKFERLGEKVIEQVLATGTRTTLVLPVGYEGNVRPITMVTETWTSPELKLNILFKRTDPHMGVFIRSVVNISRSEPDPSLFQVPPGFTVVDEPGSFSFTLTRVRPQ
jgi:hypothetical protein